MAKPKLNIEDIDNPNGRLRIVWIRSGKSQKDFATSIGLSVSGLNSLMGTYAKKSKVSKSIALAVESIYKINHEWILTGMGLQKFNPIQNLDPWERMLLEIYNRHFDNEYLERVLRALEWNERANDVLEYAEFASLEGVMSPEEHADFTANIRKHLNELQQERRIFFEQLNRNLPWEAEKDYGGESRMTRRMREFWRENHPDKHIDPEEGGGDLPLSHIIRPLIMLLHYGEAEWNRIKHKYIAYQRVIVEDIFYPLALEAILEVQAEIKELITASDDQLKFLEEIRPKHIR